VSRLLWRRRSANADDAFAITHSLAFDRINPSSRSRRCGCARDNARQVREQLSTEVWEHLNRLYLRLQPVTDRESIWVHQPARVFREPGGVARWKASPTPRLRHGEGWHFLELGRYIERAQLVSRLLDIHFGSGRARLRRAAAAAEISRLAGAPEILHGLRALLQGIHGGHQAGAHRGVPAVRSGVSAFGQIRGRPGARCAGHVAPGAPPARRAACERLAGRLKAAVDFGQIDELIGGSIDAFPGNHAAVRADSRSRLRRLYRLRRGDGVVMPG
jgi:hypothetical protein